MDSERIEALEHRINEVEAKLFRDLKGILEILETIQKLAISDTKIYEEQNLQIGILAARVAHLHDNWNRLFSAFLPSPKEG